MNSRERFFALLEGQPVDHLSAMPITMQLAGDIINRKYRDYVMDYKVLVKAQIRVADEFDFDYVSCISDPAREAADCGASVIYAENSPPAIDNQNNLLADKTKLVDLKIPDVMRGGRMTDRVKAAELFKKEVDEDKIIEGWVEGPIAEGADLRGINTIMIDFYEDPQFVRDLFEFVIEMELEFARCQIEAGVDVMGIGDAAASLIGPLLYEEFVWPYEKRLIDGIKEMGTAVRLHICGNIKDILGKIAELGCEIVDLDYMVPVSLARDRMGQDQVLLGNIDPVSILQDGSPQDVYRVVEQCHKEAGEKFIVGAGCELTRTTPFENIRVLTDYAKTH